MNDNTKRVFAVPFAYEKYGRIEVVAETEEAAVRLAEKELVNMSTTDMDELTSYLEDSLEIDEEGQILDRGPAESEESKRCEAIDEILAIAKSNGYDKDDLIQEAETVEDIAEHLRIPLFGFAPEDLRKAAEEL